MVQPIIIKPSRFNVASSSSRPQGGVHPKFLSEGDFHITTFTEPRARYCYCGLDNSPLLLHLLQWPGPARLLGSGLTRWWHAAWPVATLSPPLSSKLSTDRPKTFPFRTGRLVFYYLAMLVVLLQDKRSSSLCLCICVSVVDAKKLENFRSLHLYCRKFWFPIEASNILGSREATH